MSPLHPVPLSLLHSPSHYFSFKYFFHNRNNLDVGAMIKEAYRLMSSTPDDIHPRTLLSDFTPLTQGHYPVFNHYPQFLVEYHTQEKERIRVQEMEYFRERWDSNVRGERVVYKSQTRTCDDRENYLSVLAGKNSRPCVKILCEGKLKRKPIMRRRSVFLRLVHTAVERCTQTEYCSKRRCCCRRRRSSGGDFSRWKRKNWSSRGQSKCAQTTWHHRTPVRDEWRDSVAAVHPAGLQSWRGRCECRSRCWTAPENVFSNTVRINRPSRSKHWMRRSTERWSALTVQKNSSLGIQIISIATSWCSCSTL